MSRNWYIAPVCSDPNDTSGWIYPVRGDGFFCSWTIRGWIAHVYGPEEEPTEVQ